MDLTCRSLLQLSFSTFILTIRIWSVSSASLPIVDAGLFVIQGVQTCGLGLGYCLLSNSCQVDSDFASDSNDGHCDGLRHAFNPHANFICCQYQEPPPSTTAPTTDFGEETTTLETTQEQMTSTYTATIPSTEDSYLTQESPTTTTELSLPTSTRKPTVSPFNIAANTNKILQSIQHLLSGGRMRPSVAINKLGSLAQGNPGGDPGGIYNNKSLLNLILLGMNETLRITQSSPSAA